ncbi:MAG: NAD(P)H-hydrate epimerase [Thermoplasmata archaeon]|nr:NAD(P)H-hydrate epimerase [Thermoplasmata archaeon]
MDVPSITVDQMREVDRLMVEEFGITLPQMMENAGRILAELAIELFAPDRATIMVGKGHNGGGGLVAARYLHNKGVDTEVVLSSQDLPEVPMRRLSTLRSLDLPIASSMHDSDGIIVDALLGYSQQGTPRGKVADLVEVGERSGLPVISLDVPTGFDLETGEYHSISFKDPTTLTLGLPKVTMSGGIKDLWLADIGIPREVYSRIGLDVPVLFRETDHFKLDRMTLW